MKKKQDRNEVARQKHKLKAMTKKEEQRQTEIAEATYLPETRLEISQEEFQEINDTIVKCAVDYNSDYQTRDFVGRLYQLFAQARTEDGAEITGQQMMGIDQSMQSVIGAYESPVYGEQGIIGTTMLAPAKSLVPLVDLISKRLHERFFEDGLTVSREEYKAEMEARKNQQVVQNEPVEE